MLPRVRVLLGNGALGQVAASADNVYALLTTAAVVADKFALATTYIIRSLDDLVTDLGITAENNPGLLKAVTEFYSIAPQGTELWVRGYADTVTLTNLATLNHAGGIQSLLTEAKGRIRGIFIHRTPAAGYTPTTTEGPGFCNYCRSLLSGCPRYTSQSYNQLIQPRWRYDRRHGGR